MARPVGAVPGICSSCGGQKAVGERCRPCVRKRENERNTKPENRAGLASYAREYHQRPDVKRRRKERETPEQRESRIARNKRNYEANRSLRYSQQRQWISDNPDRVKVYRRTGQQRRRALKYGANGAHTEDEWRAILALHRNACASCGCNETLTKDHIIPLSRGGTDFAFNLQPLCKRCNSRKHAKLLTGSQHSLFDTHVRTPK